MSSGGVGLRSERGPVLLAMMVASFLVAIDSTILATAVPTIVGDIGGFSQFPWLFSIYLLAQAVSVPVYGKLADMVGRKPMILFGIGVFLLGSVLAGLAWSMPALIAFRALQGLGAGAIQPIGMTIVGDIYTVAERARVQGYLASVWAISSVVGPTLGGLIAQYLAWQWIFFVNIPFCLLAVGLVVRNFRERVERSRHRVDYLGAALLMAAVSLLILGLLEGGQAWAWDSPTSVGVLAVGGALLVLFAAVERRAAEPVLPFWVFRRRLLLTTMLLNLMIGAVLIGLESYIPSYLEGSLGVEPLTAGLTLAALTIGWPIAATISGRLYLRLGFRATILIGLSAILLSAFALVLVARTPSVATVAVVCFVMGFGLGLATAPSTVAAQSAVGWGERGVVTGSTMFARSMGSAVGVAVLGAVANAVVSGSAHGGAVTPAAVVDAASAVFLAVLVAAMLALVAGLGMPKGTLPTADAPVPRVDPLAPADDEPA